MKALWTVVKVVAALAIAIPIAIIALAAVLGLVGALVGLAFMALRVAVIGLVAWVVFRIAVALLRPAPRREAPRVEQLPPSDPHYDAALRELDRELGHASR